MNKLISLACLFALGAAVPDARADSGRLGSHLETFAPPPGAANLAPMTPPWCGRATRYRGRDVASALGRTLRGIKSRGWAAGWIADAAAMLCAHPKAPEYREQAAHFVQGYMAYTGLGKADALRALSARVDTERWEAEAKRTCARLQVSEEASPGDRARTEALAALFGCHRGGPAWSARPQSTGDLAWHLDRDAEIPELLRLYWVIACLKAPWYIDEKSGHDLARYALCGPDARRLDRKKVLAELAAGGYVARDKTLALESLAVARQSERKLRAAASRSAALKSILLEAPEAGWKSWSAAAAANRAGFEAALRFEEAFFGPSRKAARGCGQALRAGFARHFAGAGKSIEAADERAKDPLGNVFARALANCAGAEGTYYETHALVELWERGRAARGPRYAAYYAALDALSEVREDRPRFAMEPSMFLALPFVSPRKTAIDRLGDRAKNEHFAGGLAVVKRVKKEGGVVRVEFQTERWKEDVVECHDTNKVWKIDRGGKVKYFRRCKKKGTKMVKRTELPILIPAHAAAGLRPGALLEFVAREPMLSRGKARPGYPSAAWASKKRKRLVNYYGFAAK